MCNHSFATTLQGSRRAVMPSIRDLVAAIRQREGVEAVIVLGHDGILIHSQLGPGLEAEDVAARVPGIIAAADEFGVAVGKGQLVTAVLEHRNGLAVVSVFSPEVILLVLLTPRANIGQLLFELRRNREQIAAFV